MSVELEKKIIETYRTLKASSTQLTPDADIIVPDSKPDVGSVIAADVLPMICEKRVQKDYITVSGNLDYRILYLSDEKDAPSQIKGIKTRVPFTHQLEVSGVDDNAFAGIRCDVVHVSSEAVNSRKINIKSVIDFETNIIKPTEFEAVVSAVQADVPCKNRAVSYSSVAGFTENEFELSGALSSNPGLPLIDEILKVDTKICGREVKAMNGKLVAKGVVSVNVLYADENGKAGCFDGEIPFTEVLSIDNVAENMISDVEYSLTDIEYTVASDDDGDMSVLELRAMVNACAYVYERCNDSVTSDLYSPDFELSVKTDKSSLSDIVYDGIEQSAVKESISLAQWPETVKIYDASVKPYIESIKTAGDKAELCGAADVYLTCITSLEDAPVYTLKEEIPFTCNINVGNISESSQISVVCEADNIACSLPTPASADLRFVLNFETKVTDVREISYVSGAEECEDSTNNREPMPSIIIYFASKGESAWDIAKRYRTTAEQLCAVNGAELGEYLAEDMQIMIPRR